MTGKSQKKPARPAAPSAKLPDKAGGRPHRRRTFLVCAIAAGLYISFVAIIVLGRPGLGLRPGDLAMQDYVARVDFEVLDHDRTDYLRQKAYEGTPEVYHPVETGRQYLDALPGELTGILRDIYKEGESARALSSLSEGNRKFLAGFVRRLDVSNEDWASDLAARMLPLSGTELLGSRDYKRLEESPGGITVSGRADPLALNDIVNILDLPEFARGRIAGALEGTADGETAAGLLAGILKPKEKASPTLGFSEGETHRDRLNAAEAVPWKVRSISAGQIILRRGQEADDSHIYILKKEISAYRKSVPVEVKARNLVGTAILLMVVFTLGGIYLAKYEPRVLKSEMRFFILGVLLVVVLGAAKIIALRGWQLYLIPISFASMVLAIAYNPRTSIGVTWMLAIVIAFMVGGHSDLWSGATGGIDLLIYLMAGAAVGAFGSSRIRRRSRLIKVGLSVGIAYGLVVWSTGLVGGASLDAMVVNSLLGLGNGLTVGFLISGILPFIEYWFNIVTDISLLELSDQNHPLLKRLIFDAPGTYHHSLVVGNLAEEAAASIGANALLARVGSYFHDIGKLRRPEYFIENEAVPGTKHSRLTTPMSTAIILAHTRDGVELARQYNLPNKIKSIVQRHHGTSILEYFYNEALREFGGKGQVDEAAFRYPGPRPDTRESGVVLLADACEAASRALVNPSVSKLEELVDGLISKKIADGQLNETGLTLTDLARCKESFVRVLSSRFHTRVKYPNPSPAGKEGQTGILKQETVFYTRRRPEA